MCKKQKRITNSKMTATTMLAGSKEMNHLALRAKGQTRSASDLMKPKMATQL
jgi:hypothetical protein